MCLLSWLGLVRKRDKKLVLILDDLSTSQRFDLLSGKLSTDVQIIASLSLFFSLLEARNPGHWKITAGRLFLCYLWSGANQHLFFLSTLKLTIIMVFSLLNVSFNIVRKIET